MCYNVTKYVVKPKHLWYNEVFEGFSKKNWGIVSLNPFFRLVRLVRLVRPHMLVSEETINFQETISPKDNSNLNKKYESKELKSLKKS